MRVLYAICRQDEAATVYGGSWLARDFYAGFLASEHEILEIDWNGLHPRSHLSAQVKKTENGLLVERIRAVNSLTPIDIIITACDSRWLLPVTVRAIRDMGILAVNFHSDDATDFARTAPLANEFDLNWTGNKNAFPHFDAVGARFVYTPFAANPEVYRPYDTRDDLGVVFMGRNMGYREEFITHLLESGVHVDVWGLGWPQSISSLPRRLAAIWLPSRGMTLRTKLELTAWYARHATRLKERFHGLIAFQDMVRNYSRARINLDFAGGMGKQMCSFESAPRQMKLRNFEVTMSGGFLLTEHTQEIASLFTVGEEIETFRNKQELVDKCRYYLVHGEEAESIAKAGHRRAVRDYTWQRSVETLLKEVRNMLREFA